MSSFLDELSITVYIYVCIYNTVLRKIKFLKMIHLKAACIFFIVAFFSPSFELQNGGRIPYTKTRLMLEYNWPKVIKGLQRLPHAVSCDHFYVTRSDGKHDIKKCPDGLSFDFHTLLCKEKTEAKCWSKLFLSGNRFECPFPWGLYPDVKECSRYFSCLNGKSSQRKCPDSSLFDKVSRKCLNESEVMCADESDIVEPGYKCPYTWGFFTCSKDCSKYYECLQKNPSLRTCKKNMLFDNLKRKCLPKSKVDCGTRYNPYGLHSTQNNGSSTERTSTQTATALHSIQTDQRKSSLRDEYSSKPTERNVDSIQKDEIPNDRTFLSKPNATDLQLSQSGDCSTEKTSSHRAEYSQGQTGAVLHSTRNVESSTGRTSSQNDENVQFQTGADLQANIQESSTEKTSSHRDEYSPGQIGADVPAIHTHESSTEKRSSDRDKYLPGQTGPDWQATHNRESSTEKTSSHRKEYLSDQTGVRLQATHTRKRSTDKTSSHRDEYLPGQTGADLQSTQNDESRRERISSDREDYSPGQSKPDLEYNQNLERSPEKTSNHRGVATERTGADLESTRQDNLTERTSSHGNENSSH